MIRRGVLALPYGVYLAGDAHEGILRRLVPVAGRKDGGALNVRVGIGAAATEVDESHAGFLELGHKPEGLGEVRLQGVVFVHPEAVAIRQVVGKIHWASRFRAGLEGDGIEKT